MKIKIIELKNEGSIVWDCFRKSYVQLMNTVPHLIECEIKFNQIHIQKLTGRLCFKMYDTDNSQSELRDVIKESGYCKEYEIKLLDYTDDILVKHFEKFWEDYINTLDKN